MKRKRDFFIFDNPDFIFKSENLTVPEAAKFLGISKVSLRLWDKIGKFKPTRKYGEIRYYSLKDLENFKLFYSIYDS